MSCCTDTCCENPTQLQPVSTSGATIDAAQEATVGTKDTLNALIAGGFGTLTAVLTAKPKAAAAATAVKAQAQITTQKTNAIIWVAIAAIAIFGFIFAMKVRGR